ncbi:hypothetical protein GPECTOR_12g461 [Gonium pectorale]|uniref:Ammonium transporter AmtB-like domain-containing protein n=1 Tax=Gonium pectorale TaxID=33097 RepID=A0A150GP28_GONPE|nr:hypothetical protein GPECTOR_12g461 [Gonium pectorale]|eukprot:KXZ51498.1 hypothetical protein GPECTOR_12g461 [Gonium pectorale]
MSGFTSAIGACSVATLEALAKYGLDEETISGLCGDNGCSDVQDCLNMHLLSNAGSVDEKASGVALALDVSFILFSGYLVFIMQLGMNILLKNMLDACVGAMGFYLFGYAFAYGRKEGQKSNGFIGNWNFALSYTTQTSFSGEEFAAQGWHLFFFQWSFCAATTSIVSGAVAERCTFTAYLAYAFFLSSFVYPVLVHWVWDPSGWLSAFNTSRDGYAMILRTGAVDFAGSGVVHMTGGLAALMGAWIIGPRVGRFDEAGNVQEIKGHSATLVVMGTFLLWFGWFGFNPGSNLTIASQAAATVVSRIAVCTALAGGAGGIAMLLYKHATTGAWDVIAVCNGILAGLVAITSACSVVEPFGLFYGGHGQILLVQFIEVLAIAGWTCSTMGAYFFAMNKAGLLRVSQEDELAGLDVANFNKSVRNGSAYNGSAHVNGNGNGHGNGNGNGYHNDHDGITEKSLAP